MVCVGMVEGRRIWMSRFWGVGIAVGEDVFCCICIYPGSPKAINSMIFPKKKTNIILARV